MAIEWLLSGYWVATEWLWDWCKVGVNTPDGSRVQWSSLRASLSMIVYTRARLRAAVHLDDFTCKSIYWRIPATGPVHINFQSAHPLHPPLAPQSTCVERCASISYWRGLLLAMRSIDGEMQSVSPFRWQRTSSRHLAYTRSPQIMSGTLTCGLFFGIPNTPMLTVIRKHIQIKRILIITFVSESHWIISYFDKF